MKERISQYFVIFTAISLIIGAFFNEVVNNKALILSITIAAVAFTLLDFLRSMNWDNKYSNFFKYVLLLISVFSIILLPYLTSIHNILGVYTDRITIIGLALVILLIGIKQLKDENKDIKQINDFLDESEKVRSKQIEIIDKQISTIEKLNEELKKKSE